MMHKGVDIWEAAGVLGMPAKILDKVCGHSLTDSQENVAEV